MGTREILVFFETVRIKDLASFRSLCNALKALVIRQAVQTWRSSASGRLGVLDLGCGRGGDLRKWSSYRLRSYHGVDGAPLCVEEASARQTALVAQGKSNVQAFFSLVELLTERLPCADGSSDVVSSMFFLQFAFASKRAADHVLDEVARVLTPQGVFCCILPDGNRVASLLTDRRRQVAFGHFKLHSEGSFAPAKATEPFGVAYNFALSDAPCTEYVASPRLLQALLEARGFAGAWPDGEFFRGAQQVLSEDAGSETVGTVLRGQKCSPVDWMSLGFFSVVLARKTAPPPPPEEPREQPRTVAKRRRGGGQPTPA